MSKQQVLVFGGTRFFGKHLVSALIAEGCDVTIATRGEHEDPFGTRVKRVRVDRADERSMKEAFAAHTSWDVIFDQICFSPTEAQMACDQFEGKVGRYIFTSTQSVYTKTGCLVEEDFDPYHYTIQMGVRGAFDYGEGKRLAEAVFVQRASFPVAAVRFPIVLGPDDYTGRLEFHIERVLNDRPIVIGNRDARSSFIRSTEAGAFLAWLGLHSDFTGPINACSNDSIAIGETLALIEQRTNKKAHIMFTGSDEDRSPFANETSWYMDNAKASKLGFTFSALESWLPSLITELADSIRSKEQALQ